MGGYDNYKYNYNESNINNQYNIDISNFSEDDKEELYLLNIQKFADIIFIVSDVISYISTKESIDLIYSKYGFIPDRIPNPDVSAIQSIVLTLAARLIYTQIGFIRYEHLYDKKINGELEYSLKPNVDINISNIFRTVGNFYGLMAAIEIYNRDMGQPIFGI